MRRITALIVLAALLAPSAGRAEDPVPDDAVFGREGYRSLVLAADEAKRTGKRLLVGLFGSPG